MIIYPSILKGEVKIPPSKSMAHRAIICAALAKGESIIENVDYSDDILATMGAMEALGATIHRDGSTLTINGENSLKSGDCSIQCNESGSTLRFIVPISLLKEGSTRFLGTSRLGERPLTPYKDICKQQNIHFEANNPGLDTVVNGKLKAGEFTIAGNISSQFISGLCFTLPLLEGDSIIHIEGELESRSYTDMTLQMLKHFGIEIICNDYKEFKIKGGQRYLPGRYEVEADFSQSAFFFVMGALSEGMTLLGLNPQSKQGDKAVVSLLKKMNAQITLQNNSYIVSPSTLKGTTIDASDCPDIIPVLAMAAACAEGQTVIKNAQRLRIKESDRLSAVFTELSTLGAKVLELPDGLIIDGVASLGGGKVSSWNDHRIAMSLASISPKCKGNLELDNHHCTAKSFPSFWEVFRSLGGKTDLVGG
ncbi:MAG: 3-phosphoshikimate 1-carboxyvinyltransferase [Brevinema sp.]